MFLELSHTKLDVYKVTHSLVLACYEETRKFPSDEKFAMISQIRRAALSVFLNVSEGSSRKSIAERKRFYEIARGSLVEMDAAFDIAIDLKYTSRDSTAELGSFIIRSFQLISKLISK